MLKIIKYLFFLSAVLAACETVYVPDLEDVEDVLTVDARFVKGQRPHVVTLRKSMGFNENGSFDTYSDARVTVTDSKGNNYESYALGGGEYWFNFQLDNSLQYQLNISAEGETYSSVFESVPPPPDIDTFYTEETEIVIQPGGETDVDEFVTSVGHRFYVDIDNDENSRYYRFDARKILQYYFPFDTVMYGLLETATKYAWKSIYPTGKFDIAAPAEYSSNTDIFKHSTQFFNYRDRMYLRRDDFSNGWIYIMHQYGISESAYHFYQDLNNQLDADGKIFDPMYVQARNNLKCDSNPGKTILGNFEIASYREHRFYIHLDPYKGFHEIRRIETFYDIPENGEKAIFLPWFWES
jgi:hypothetical protein